MLLNIFEADFALGFWSWKFIMLMENANPTALHFLISLATSGSWCIFCILLTVLAVFFLTH